MEIAPAGFAAVHRRAPERGNAVLADAAASVVRAAALYAALTSERRKRVRKESP